MKKFLCFLLVISMFFCCMSSCAKKDDFNEDFSEGYQKGQKDLFMSIWSELAYDKVITAGVKWETEDFSIVFADKKTVDDLNLSWVHVEYDITLKNMTIDECYENENMFFGIYSINADNHWEIVWTKDDYYWDVIVWDGIDGPNAKGSIGLFEDEYKYLAIIIIVDGSIYKAAYEFN